MRPKGGEVSTSTQQACGTFAYTLLRQQDAVGLMVADPEARSQFLLERAPPHPFMRSAGCEYTTAWCSDRSKYGDRKALRSV